MRTGKRSKRGVKDEGKSIVFIDESGFMLQPNLIATFAPIGETPILKCWDRHDRLSVIAAITMSPKIMRFGLYFSVFDENITNIQVVEFLKSVRRTLGRDITVVLDRWSAHRKASRILSQKPFGKGNYSFEFLPAYAPELNPVEFIWGHTKNNGMANFAPEDIYEIDSRLDDTLGVVTKCLVLSAFKHSGLDV